MLKFTKNMKSVTCGIVSVIVHLCLIVEANDVPSPPKILVTGNTIGRYLRAGINNDPKGSVNLTVLQDNTYVVPSAVEQLVMDCSAFYPVMWNLMQSDINSEMFPYVHVRTKRVVSDLFDPTSFNYSTQMILKGPSTLHKFTGNYSCQSTAKTHIQSNVFIYWEGSGVETLVHSKESITTYVKKDGTVMLPCGVSNPALARPKLMKRERNNRNGVFVEIGLNDSVSYLPTSGFTLALPNPLGVYKCIVHEGFEDIVTVVVKNGTSNTVRKPNTTFTYDPATNEVECCSGGRRPPSIFLVHCENAVTCQYREHLVEPYHYIFSRTHNTKNCARKVVRFYHTVLIRCIGDGIDEYKEMITPIITSYNPWDPFNIAAKMKIFSSWEQIESQEMIALEIYPLGVAQPSATNNSVVLYDKQTLKVECKTSQYYFSEGNYWAIRWKNKTLTPMIDSNIKISSRYLLNSDILSYTLKTSMDSLLCFAPVWNSSVWVIKTQFLYVNETVKPTLLRNDSLGYTWSLNETLKTITCAAKGAPDPTFSWTQGNTRLDSHNDNSHNYNITSTTTKDKTNGTNVVTTVLKILTVSYSTHGQFVCTASNYGGSVSRSFNVTVLQSSSMNSATIWVIFGILFIFGLIAALIWGLWYGAKAQKEVQHLTSVHFKDAATREHVVGADIANTTYDNGKLTSQLIS